MLRRARRVKREGFRRYEGDPEGICGQIIADAYDKERGYFRVSSGHFCEFYVRDFALCCEALVALGYQDEVACTVEYAMRAFEREGRIATMITPRGKAYDFPAYGPDALALFLLTLSRTGHRALATGHKRFLQREVDRFVRLVVDERTMLPRRGTRFTSMRDHTKRDASCYDATMVALAARECEALGLRFPFAAGDAAAKVKEAYWNGAFFCSDLRERDLVIGDANTMPFWTRVCRDRRMRASACAAVGEAGLDDPFPLRYVSTRDKAREKVDWHLAAALAPGYETDSVWAHLGLAYLRVLAQADAPRARRHVRAYGGLIRRHGTFLELYDAHGAPYETPLYVTDEAMLWCAPWLALARELEVRA